MRSLKARIRLITRGKHYLTGGLWILSRATRDALKENRLLCAELRQKAGAINLVNKAIQQAAPEIAAMAHRAVIAAINPTIH